MTSKANVRSFTTLMLFGVLALLASCGSTNDSAASTEPSRARTPAADEADSSTEAGDAVADGGAVADDDAEARPASEATTSSDQDAGSTTSVVSPGDLPLLAGGRTVAADLDGPTAELITLSEAPYIGAAVYPRPGYEANPWSHWGQGFAMEDGRVLTAMGDHLGADGNSYLYLYDPDRRTLTRFADVMSALDHQPGSWGYGKIHSQMVDAGDGGIYFTTYYGSRRGLTYSGSYTGDVLFRLDKSTLEIQPLAVPVPGHGIPSLASNGAGLIYGEAVDPLVPDEVYPQGGLLVYDTETAAVRRFEENPGHRVFRNVLVDADGAAWFAAEDGALFHYDPDTDTVTAPDGANVGPGGLRATTRSASDGTVYGVTLDPFEFFAFRDGQRAQSLGRAQLYTTTLALTPDESAFLHIPGAHGRSLQIDTPLIAVDTTTGEQTTIVELADLLRDEFGLVAGGTYSITVDRDRGHAHIVLNAGRTDDEPWGELLFVVVDLP